MPYIEKEIRHEPTGILIEVLRKGGITGETFDKNHIIQLSDDSLMRNYLTPSALIRLGNWIAKEGRKIKKEYDGYGNRVFPEKQTL